jgi:hypothetical protein
MTEDRSLLVGLTSWGYGCADPGGFYVIGTNEAYRYIAMN